MQAAGLYGDVDAEGGGCQGQVGPQRVSVGTGHVELDAGDRLAGEPADLVDVRAACRDPRGDRGDGRRRERAAKDGHVQSAAGRA